MKISGFTFVKNATKLYIPAKQAIASVLPLVDEFVVALGKGDEDDRTKEEILSLNSDKIKIVETEWNTNDFKKNTIFAQQTDVAKQACTGDWLFYIQCDEAIHEKYLPIVKQAMQQYLNDPKVEGLLFQYKHFWGDYQHYNQSHVFYPREIRAIKNDPSVHSWKDAQSFRKYEHPPKTMDDYDQKLGTEKLNVATIPAEIFHYGWVRPPKMMRTKMKSNSTSYRGAKATEKQFENKQSQFSYGPLNRTTLFKGTHPATMSDWIEKLDWQDELLAKGNPKKGLQKEKHEKPKYRILTWVETQILGGKQIGEFKNFVITKKFKPGK